MEEVYPRRRFVQIGVVQVIRTIMTKIMTKIITAYKGGIGRCGSAHYPDAFVSLQDPDVHEFVRSVAGSSSQTETAEVGED